VSMAVTLHTDLGDLKLEVFCESAPNAAKKFLGIMCHRIL